MSDASATVSAVISTHNRAEFVAVAIRSALSQSYAVNEVIVVDDDSKDNTADIVRGFSDPRVQYLKLSSNQGGSAARNAGIRAAKSDFVAFLDDDDQWCRDKIEKQLHAGAEFDAVFSSATKLSSRNQRFDGSIRRIEANTTKRGFTIPGGTSNLMARRDVLTNEWFDETLPAGQDWDMLIRLACRYRVAFLNEPLVSYNDGVHTRMGNESTNQTLDQLHTRARVLRKHRKFLGYYWYHFHLARTLLSNYQQRNNKLSHLIQTIRVCGVVGTLAVLPGKLWRQTRRIAG